MKAVKALLAASILTTVGTAAIADSHGNHASMDIVDTAVSAGDFETLVIAVQEAGLVETLKGDGPFTVFAPNDEAFAKLPPDQLQALLADKAALTKVLTYHVVPGRVMAVDVVELTSANTVEGQAIVIDASDGVTVNGAAVIATDIVASNGVIHVIDTVILPPDLSRNDRGAGEMRLASTDSPSYRALESYTR